MGMDKHNIRQMRSSSLTNLDSSSKRAQIPLLPDISQKGNMNKSLQGHHSSSKRFVRERYNPPFKVNAKIRHVYTQEVTTIEQGPEHHHSHGHRSSSNHYSGNNLRSSQSSYDIVSCHRQTQTELSKQKPEVDEGQTKGNEEVDGVIDQRRGSYRPDSKRKGNVRTGESGESKKVDAATSPIPCPFFTTTSLENGDSGGDPFSGCSQMNVYPPLNYVRKLEDLEKITGHIVIQRFFTKTDDKFGTWLERQLGITTKSVSVDTSEFENAKNNELQTESAQDSGVNENENATVNPVEEETDAVVIEAEVIKQEIIEQKHIPVLGLESESSKESESPRLEQGKSDAVIVAEESSQEKAGVATAIQETEIKTQSTLIEESNGENLEKEKVKSDELEVKNETKEPPKAEEITTEPTQKESKTPPNVVLEQTTDLNVSNNNIINNTEVSVVETNSSGKLETIVESNASSSKTETISESNKSSKLETVEAEASQKSEKVVESESSTNSESSSETVFETAVDSSSSTLQTIVESEPSTISETVPEPEASNKSETVVESETSSTKSEKVPEPESISKSDAVIESNSSNAQEIPAESMPVTAPEPASQVPTNQIVEIEEDTPEKVEIIEKVPALLQSVPPTEPSLSEKPDPPTENNSPVEAVTTEPVTTATVPRVPTEPNSEVIPAPTVETIEPKPSTDEKPDIIPTDTPDVQNNETIENGLDKSSTESTSPTETSDSKSTLTIPVPIWNTDPTNGQVADTTDSTFIPQEEFIAGEFSNPGEGFLAETVNRRPPELNPPADCGFTDHVKCECYLEELERASEYEKVKRVEEEIVKESMNDAGQVTVSDYPMTLISTTSSIPTLPPLVEEVEVENNKVATERILKCNKNEEDIDEVVRCTLEAYLMAPLAFEDIPESDEVEKENKKNELDSLTSPGSGNNKNAEIDSGRADSIQSSQDIDRSFDTEGNTTSHDSVETVYEIPIAPPKELDNVPVRTLQRCLSADSCIGTESSGDVKNQTANASQSSNDTIEVIDNSGVSRDMVDMSLEARSSAPPSSARSQTTKLPAIPSAKSIKAYKPSARSQRSMSPGTVPPVKASGRGKSGGRRNEKTDIEGEDADAESETESEITDQYLLSGRPCKHHLADQTDIELEEVEEDIGDDDDRDAFDKMVANHLKYSRGLSTAAAARRSRLNRGTQTTKSIEPSTTSGSMSPCSSSASSFDVEIISKSKRITTASTSGGDGDLHNGMITPSNMTLAWHEGSRRRSYLPNSSSSLNLLNMKFSLGKDFESEVSIRMPTTNKSSMLTGNMGSAMVPGSGDTSGKTPLMSGSSRSHHHHYQSYATRGLSSSSHHSTHRSHPLQSPLTSATTTTATMQLVSDRETQPTSTVELQSLWKDVRSKLDVQVDELMASTIQEEDLEGLQVKGSGILPLDPAPDSGSSMVKLKRNEEKIKRSLQRLKKILDDKVEQ